MRADAAQGSDDVRTLRPGPSEDLAVITDIASNWLTKNENEKIAADDSAEAEAVAAMGPTPEERIMNQSRDKIQRLMEEFRLVKKFWAHDAKEMGRQLGRLASQLKEALSDYAKAAKGAGNQMGAPVVGAMTAPPAAASSSADTQGDRGEAVSHTEAEAAQAVDAEREAGIAPPAMSHSQAQMKLAATYGLADTSKPQAGWFDRGVSLHGNTDFFNQVREFVTEMKDTLNGARLQKVFTVQDREDKEDAFAKADKAFKSLDEELAGFEEPMRLARPFRGLIA